MARYTFHLASSLESPLESPNTIKELANDAAAYAHAETVAAELNRNSPDPLPVIVLDEHGHLVHRTSPPIL